jgi:WD40 repeat protein
LKLYANQSDGLNNVLDKGIELTPIGAVELTGYDPLFSNRAFGNSSLVNSLGASLNSQIVTYGYSKHGIKSCHPKIGDNIKILDVAGSFDGKFWAAAYEDNTVKIWDCKGNIQRFDIFLKLVKFN